MAEQQNNLEMINNQINNCNAIKTLTGYNPGIVYLYDEDKAKNNKDFEHVDSWNGTDYKKRGDKMYSRSVYDTDSGNFHIVPSDDKTRLKYLRLINKAMKNLQPVIDEELQKKLDDHEKKCSLGRGVSKTHLDIERYISFTYKGYDYMLCFERLYKDGDQINSLLGAFQFYRQPVKFYIFYPESCKDGEKTPIKIDNLQMIVQNPANLPSVETVANGERVDDVCNAFIKFIFDKTE